VRLLRERQIKTDRQTTERQTLSKTLTFLTEVINSSFHFGYLFLTYSFGVNPYKLKNMKFDLSKLETLLYILRCEIYFDILNRLGMDDASSVTDRQTD